MKTRRCWLIAGLLPLAACIGAPKPMAPDAALRSAAQEITVVLNEETALRVPAPLQPSEKTDAPREISFWYYDHPLMSPAFGPMPEENAFSRAHPGIALHAQFIGQWDVAVQKLTVALAANDLPDVALVKRGMLAQLIPSGRILPLETFLPPSLLNDLREPARKAFTVDGRLYALPADGFCDVLLYDADRIDQTPANRKKLQAVARQMSPRLKRNEFAVGFLPFLPLLWSAGGHVFDGDTDLASFVPATTSCLLNDSPASETLAFLLSLKTEGLTHPQLLSNEAAALQAFRDGHITMTVASSADLKEAKKAPFKVGVAPIPGVNGPVSLLSDNAVVVFRRYADAKHEALVEFLDYLTGPDLQGADAAARGSNPVRTSVAAQTSPPRELAAAYDAAIGTPLHPAWSRIESILDRYLGLAYAWNEPAKQ